MRLAAMKSASEQPEKPSIDLSAIKDITIKAGQDLKIVVPVKSHPPPTVSWEQNGSPVDKTRSRLEVSHIVNIRLFVTYICMTFNIHYMFIIHIRIVCGISVKNKSMKKKNKNVLTSTRKCSPIAF